MGQLWFDCCDLESDLHEFVGWGCERGLTGGGASQQMNVFHFNRKVLFVYVNASSPAYSEALRHVPLFAAVKPIS